MVIKEKKLISVFGNSFDKSDFKAFKNVLKSHLVGTGEVTKKFEEEFKNRIGFKYASAVSSCTNGFWLLLRALEFNPKDEVLIPNIHFFGIRNVLELLDIKYKIIDVGEPVPNITEKEITSHITKRTKAIIFLEYGGYPIIDIRKIKQYLQKHQRKDIVLILDAANSPFTIKDEKYSALDFDYAVYSFDMNKLLVTGEGGIVLSNNGEILKKVKSLSYYGIVDSLTTGFDKSLHRDIWWEVKTAKSSLKLNMNNLSASLGLTQLNKIDTIMQKRKAIARKYYNDLRPLESEGLLLLPPEYKNVENNVYLFWLRLKGEETRNKLAQYLLRQNVYTTVKYQPLDEKALTPNAFRFYKSVLNIPFNQNLTLSQQKYIIKHIKEFFRHEN